MGKGARVRDIRPGGKVEGLFCVSEKALRTTRNGAPFLVLTLSDNTGQIEARVWDNAQELGSGFDKGDIIFIEADAVEFNGQCQLKVNRCEQALDEEIDPSHFLPVSPCDLKKAWQVCSKAIKRVKEPNLALVLKEIFSDKATKKAFKEAPAAKRMHHAYIGGLLEHSASLVELVGLVVNRYPHLHSDLLVSASLLHDIGKIRELSWARPPIDYTDEGRLLGHIQLGVEIIDSACKGLGISCNSENILALKHIVLSHHGQKEFGSPVLPMTEEAVVFHMLDDLDAKLNFLSGLKMARGETKSWGWSDYQHLFERFFFLPPFSMQETDEKATEQGIHKGKGPIQPTLWDTDES
ncbi:MAG: HD domain-containing protein [Thermodesulfobacteria bacterium]|nr:HD domain-containing protein [Thermodesulfobacteriota bacterium]